MYRKVTFGLRMTELGLSTKFISTKPRITILRKVSGLNLDLYAILGLISVKVQFLGGFIC